jgi:hypothetical protein
LEGVDHVGLLRGVTVRVTEVVTEICPKSVGGNISAGEAAKEPDREKAREVFVNSETVIVPEDRGVELKRELVLKAAVMVPVAE